MKKICILSLGWLGRKVYEEFQGKFNCSGSYSNNPKYLENEFQFNINIQSEHRYLNDSDIIFFNLTPSSIENTTRLKDFFIRYSDKRIILISSTGIYKDEMNCDEDSLPDLLNSRSRKIFEIEQSLIHACSDYIILRCAGLYGQGRHPGIYLSGKKEIEAGDSFVNLVSDKDILDVLKKVINQSSLRVINLVNNNHPLKKEYYTRYCLDQNIEPPSFLGGGYRKIVKTKYKDFEIKSNLP